MNRLDQLLFAGTHGYVTALNKLTGKEAWRRSLPGTGFSIVTLLFEEGVLYAASGGHVFALNPLNGEIAWENPLQGLGTSALCLATIRSSANASSDPVPQAQAEIDAAAHAANHSAT